MGVIICDNFEFYKKSKLFTFLIIIYDLDPNLGYL